jgi:hypothetical protein
LTPNAGADEAFDAVEADIARWQAVIDKSKRDAEVLLATKVCVWWVCVCVCVCVCV